MYLFSKVVLLDWTWMYSFVESFHCAGPRPVRNVVPFKILWLVYRKVVRFGKGKVVPVH
jgi:hypothetical protein